MLNKKKNRLRRAPSSGISLSGGQSPTAHCVGAKMRPKSPPKFQGYDHSYNRILGVKWYTLCGFDSVALHRGGRNRQIGRNKDVEGQGGFST